MCSRCCVQCFVHLVSLDPQDLPKGRGSAMPLFYIQGRCRWIVQYITPCQSSTWLLAPDLFSFPISLPLLKSPHTLFWERVLLCSPCRSQTCDPSASKVLICRHKPPHLASSQNLEVALYTKLILCLCWWHKTRAFVDLSTMDCFSKTTQKKKNPKCQWYISDTNRKCPGHSEQQLVHF